MHTIPRSIRFIFFVALFLFATLFLMRVAAWYYLTPTSLPANVTLKVFWMGFRYDAREVGIVCLLLLIMATAPMLHPFKKAIGKKITLGVLFIALLTVIFFYTFDFLHFRYLLQRLNASALSFLDDAKISGTMVWQTYPVIRIIVAMVAALLLMFWSIKKIYKSVEKTPYKAGKSNRILFFILAFIICALGIFGRVGQYPLRWSDAFNLGSDFQANLALNPFQSFFSSLSFRASSFDKQQVKKYYPFISSYLQVTNPDTALLNFERINTPVQPDTLKKQPNIIVVICESFSGYKSSMWGNPTNTTPYFNQMCKEGLFFDNCFTPAYGTARGVWATITGIPDVELNKTASRNPSMVNQHTIINDFVGYEKFYFLGGSTSWANMRGLLTNNIKNLHLYEDKDYQSPTVDVWGISDKNLFKEAGAILKQQQKPFFAVIQTADNHRPYTIPKEEVAFKKVNVASDTLRKYGFESNDELNAFRFTDYCYEYFIENAKKENYFKNTIFLFIGDHGIGGNAGNMFPPAWTNNGLAQYHVPLLIYAPNIIDPKRLNCIASQVDVLPTLAGLAGINYSNTGLGKDLIKQYALDSGKNNIAFIFDPNTKDVGVINKQWYYTRNKEASREKMLWADFAMLESKTDTNVLIENYRNSTNAFFETARYMLKNNKKK